VAVRVGSRDRNHGHPQLVVERLGFLPITGHP
jgi:hypothetical protein